MTDKQIKEELKQVATNLGNIEFTVEDELKFCKEVLKRKEQECKKLNQTLTEIKEIAKTMYKNYHQEPDLIKIHAFNKILQKISECGVE